jgi:hypothetical protein
MMNNLKSKKWWQAAGVRAIRTMAQVAVATIGSTTLITDVNWAVVISSTVMAGVVSLLTSIGGLPEVKEGE